MFAKRSIASRATRKMSGGRHGGLGPFPQNLGGVPRVDTQFAGDASGFFVVGQHGPTPASVDGHAHRLAVIPQLRGQIDRQCGFLSRLAVTPLQQTGGEGRLQIERDHGQPLGTFGGRLTLVGHYPALSGSFGESLAESRRIRLFRRFG